MIKLLLLNIINKFIPNVIKLNSNGLYSFRSDYQRSDSKIEEKKTHLSCLKILEETLKEMKYLKADDKMNRDQLYKIIVEMENISSESIILLMAFLKNSEQTDDDIDKLNYSLISNFHTNDIDFFIGILVNVLGIKSGNVNDLTSILTQFNSMLCFLTDTPYEIDTTVGIYDDIIVDDNINIAKTYKIKYKRNSLDLNSSKKDKCFDEFYIDPDVNPIRRTKPANVFLKAGWERKLLKQLEVKGVLKKTANWIYNDLMFLVGKSKDTEEVYFKNEPMCQRRWTNIEIQNDDQWDADYDGEEYIDIGEDVFNLYDPEVTEHTPENSDLYKNNEILKKIWFYSDDLFPVQPHTSPNFNILDRRSPFAFKTLEVSNSNMFKSSPFNKENLHIILPILWLYKIYDEYKSIASNVEIDNKIKLFFDYFKPEDMLLYFKKYILLEYNTFDLETLSFLIILGALSKVTSLLIDNRVLESNITDFEPKNFNLFGRLNVHEIRDLIKNNPIKKSNYFSYLDIIIQRYIFDDDLSNKIHEEYETRNDEKRQYYIRMALNVMQLTSNFTKFTNGLDYNDYPIYKMNNIFGRQLLQIDNNIETLVTPQLLLESIATAESNPNFSSLLVQSPSNPISIMNNATSYTPLDILNYGTPSFNNLPVPMGVHVSLASNLVQFISGDKPVKGMGVSNAMTALKLIKYRANVLSNVLSNYHNYTSVPLIPVTPSTIQDSSLDQDPEVQGLFAHFRNITGSSVSASNSEIIELLFQNAELVYKLGQLQKMIFGHIEGLTPELKEDLANGDSTNSLMSVVLRRMQHIIEARNEFIPQIIDIQSRLASISEQVPLDPNIESVKVAVTLHGQETNLNKRVVMNCGKFRYIGLLGESGKSTAFQVEVDKMFSGIPSPESLPKPLSEYCEFPIIDLQIQYDYKDELSGGVLVEIQYKNGTKEQKHLVTNNQLATIFKKNTETVEGVSVTNTFTLDSVLPVLESLLRFNGLDPSRSSIVFSSCRPTVYPLRSSTEYIFEELAIDVDICHVYFNPQTPVEYIPDEVKRVILKPDQHIGDIVVKEPRAIFDPNNPRRFAGQIVEINFPTIRGDSMVCFRDGDLNLAIHYSNLMAFNNYLKQNPFLLTRFNSLSRERKHELFTEIILHQDHAIILPDPVVDVSLANERLQHLDRETPEGLKEYFREIWVRNIDIEPYYDQLFYELYNGVKKGEIGQNELLMGRPHDVDMGLLLRQHLRRLAQEQFIEKYSVLGIFAGLLPGGNNIKQLKGGNPEQNIDLDKLIEEAQHFNFSTYMIDLKTIYFEDPSILNYINKLNINNAFKAIKIQIEKIKIYIRITLKRNIDEEFFKFISSYFYEVVYYYLLMILNKYKDELNQLDVKLTKAREYFNLFEKNCIREDYFDFKTQKINKSDILDKKKILIQDYNSGLLFITRRDLSDSKGFDEWNNDIISILQNLQHDDHPIFKNILEKHRDLIDDLIIQRLANYIMLYDISISSCDLKAEIEKIEIQLLMEKSININILEPLTLFIPNYNELFNAKYDFYIDKSLSLIRDKKYDMFIDCDFVKNYYKLIYNKIVNIQSNIFEIRKTNKEINEFFNIIRMRNLNNPFALPAKYNIYKYSEQLSYYLNNVDKIFNILKDDIPLENDIDADSQMYELDLVPTIDIKPISDDIMLWKAENTPNTVENKLLLLREQFNTDYELVKMNDLIFNLII